jgi:hypothetical protein
MKKGWWSGSSFKPWVQTLVLKKKEQMVNIENLQETEAIQQQENK